MVVDWWSLRLDGQETKNRKFGGIFFCGPDGKSIVSGASDEIVRIWDAASGAETAEMEEHTDMVNSNTNLYYISH